MKRSFARPMPMILFSVLFLGAVQGGEPPPATNSDDHTVLFNTLGPDDSFHLAGKQSPEFAEGPVKNSQALLLKPTDAPQSGVSFTLDTRSLEEGTGEIWFFPDEESLPAGSERYILTMGTGGNTKFLIKMRGHTLLASVFDLKRTTDLKGPNVELNAWHHVAVTWSLKTGAVLFLDGESVATDPKPITIWGLYQAEFLQVGDCQDYNPEKATQEWSNSSNNFVGRVANLRISNIARESFPEVKK